MFLEDQIKAIGVMEISVVEKALLGAKVLIDYTRDQLAGASISIFGFRVINFNFPDVEKAKPVSNAQ
jgi:hypothetical protein